MRTTLLTPLFVQEIDILVLYFPFDLLTRALILLVFAQVLRLAASGRKLTREHPPLVNAEPSFQSVR